VHPQQLCFFKELTTEAEEVQVGERWRSLTPPSTNCQLRSLGLNRWMMPDLEMSLDVTPRCPVYRRIFCRKKVMVPTSLPIICEGCQLVIGIS